MQESSDLCSIKVTCDWRIPTVHPARSYSTWQQRQGTAPDNHSRTLHGMQRRSSQSHVTAARNLGQRPSDRWPTYGDHHRLASYLHIQLENLVYCQRDWLLKLYTLNSNWSNLSSDLVTSKRKHSQKCFLPYFTSTHWVHTLCLPVNFIVCVLDLFSYLWIFSHYMCTHVALLSHGEVSLVRLIWVTNCVCVHI